MDGEFKLGRVLFEEFRHYEPRGYLLASDVPTLIVHGDQDNSVSYEIAWDAVAAKRDATLHTVAGSDHGFDTRRREDEAISATVDWLEAQQPRPA